MKIKEALDILMTPSNQHLNQDEGLELYTVLLDDDDEADGRWAKLHLWPHLQDMSLLTYSMVHALSSVIFVPSFT